MIFIAILALITNFVLLYIFYPLLTKKNFYLFLCFFLITEVGLLGLYMTLGRPDLTPLTQTSQVEKAAQNLEEKFIKEPMTQDALLIAVYYKEQNDHIKAKDWFIKAKQQALHDKEEESLLAFIDIEIWEMEVEDNQGKIPESIKQSLYKFERQDRSFIADSPKIAYYLGLSYLQDDKYHEALKIFQELISASDVSAPWIPDCVGAIRIIEKNLGLPAGSGLVKPRMMDSQP